eukprot:6197034-Prymnesium_polylepis.1
MHAILGRADIASSCTAARGGHARGSARGTAGAAAAAVAGCRTGKQCRTGGQASGHGGLSLLASERARGVGLSRRSYLDEVQLRVAFVGVGIVAAVGGA